MDDALMISATLTLRAMYVLNSIIGNPAPILLHESYISGPKRRSNLTILGSVKLI